MDNDTKRFMAKILGEIYRVQNQLEIGNEIDEATIFGLTKGVEEIIDNEIESIGEVPRSLDDAVSDILQTIDESVGADYLSKFHSLEKAHGRMAIKRCFRFMLLRSRFGPEIDSLKNIPAEMHQLKRGIVGMS